MPHDTRRRLVGAFTVLELMVALAILAILVGIAVPTFNRLQLKAATSEAKVNIAAIRTAENIYNAEFGRFLTAAPTPSFVPGSRPGVFTGGGLTDFHTLGWQPEGNVYFQYAVTVDPMNPRAYVADARADIDGDGRNQVWGYVHPDPSRGSVSAGLLGCTAVISGANPSATNTVGPCGSTFGQSIF